MGLNVGLMGGIGQGLQSFAQAYQTALNYQLEKQKVASLADYQSRMANAAEQTANAGNVNAAGGLIEKAGMKNFRQFGGGLNLSPVIYNQDQQSSPEAMPQQQSQPQVQPVQGLVNPLPSGMVGPQPSPGMIAASQSQAIPRASGSQTFGGLSADQLMDLPSSQRQYYLGEQAKLNAHELSLAGRGYQTDPNTNQPTYSNNVLGQQAKASDQLKQEQVNKIPMERAKEAIGVKNASMEQYDKFKTAWKGNEIKQNADFADESYQKVVDSFNKPSKFGDKALVLNLVKLDMGKQAAREGTLEHMYENPQIMSRWGDYINQATNGTLSEQSRNDVMATATRLRNATRSAFEDHRLAAVEEARHSGIDPSFASDTPYRRLDKVAADFENRFKTNPSAPPEGSFTQKVGGKIQGLLGTTPSVHADQMNPPNGMVAVSNGNKTLYIQPNDLSSAMKEGWKKVGK